RKDRKDRKTGIQEFRIARRQECRNSGRQEYFFLPCTGGQRPPLWSITRCPRSCTSSVLAPPFPSTERCSLSRLIDSCLLLFCSPWPQLLCGLFLHVPLLFIRALPHPPDAFRGLLRTSHGF